LARPLSLADAGKFTTCRLIARPAKVWFPEIAPQGSLHDTRHRPFGFELWEVSFEQTLACSVGVAALTTNDAGIVDIALASAPQTPDLRYGSGC